MAVHLTGLPSPPVCHKDPALAIPALYKWHWCLSQVPNKAVICAIPCGLIPCGLIVLGILIFGKCFLLWSRIPCIYSILSHTVVVGLSSIIATVLVVVGFLLGNVCVLLLFICHLWCLSVGEDYSRTTSVQSFRNWVKSFQFSSIQCSAMILMKFMLSPGPVMTSVMEFPVAFHMVFTA